MNPLDRYQNAPPLVQGGQGRTDRDVSRAAWIFALCLAGLALLSVAAIVATTILRVGH